MIKSLFANNYKSLVNFKIDFDDINIIIGKNGGGKSTVLYLLVFLRDFLAGINDSKTSFPDITRTRWMKSNIQTFELEVEKDNKNYKYHLEIMHNGQNDITVNYESLFCEGILLLEAKNKVLTLYGEKNTTTINIDSMRSGISLVFESQDTLKIFEFKQEIVSKLIICSPDPKSMSIFSRENEQMTPTENFDNIVSVCSYLSQSQLRLIIEIWNRLKEINPLFEETKIEMTNFGKCLFLVYRIKDVLIRMNFGELSDGEKKLIALYILVYGYMKTGMTVLIDEPDNYLSIDEIQPWCAIVEEICKQFGGQCVVVSHNSEVIDYFAADYALWMKKLSSGESVLVDDPFLDYDKERFMRYSELIAGGYGEI